VTKAATTAALSGAGGVEWAPRAGVRGVADVPGTTNGYPFEGEPASSDFGREVPVGRGGLAGMTMFVPVRVLTPDASTADLPGLYLR
jgi:hypothetical protein